MNPPPITEAQLNTKGPNQQPNPYTKYPILEYIIIYYFMFIVFPIKVLFSFLRSFKFLAYYLLSLYK
jgi:hypothetical protein